MLSGTPRTFIGSPPLQGNDMTCAHCERAVSEEIAAVAGVEAVTVDLASGTVTVTADCPVDRADLAAAADEAGAAPVPRLRPGPPRAPPPPRRAHPQPPPPNPPGGEPPPFPPTEARSPP